MRKMHDSIQWVSGFVVQTVSIRIKSGDRATCQQSAFIARNPARTRVPSGPEDQPGVSLAQHPLTLAARWPWRRIISTYRSKGALSFLLESSSRVSVVSCSIFWLHGVHTHSREVRTFEELGNQSSRHRGSPWHDRAREEQSHGVL